MTSIATTATTSNLMNSHQLPSPQDSMSPALQGASGARGSGGGGGGAGSSYSNAVFERLLQQQQQQNRSTAMNGNTNVGSSGGTGGTTTMSSGSAPGPGSSGINSIGGGSSVGDSAVGASGATSLMSHQDFLSAQHQHAQMRERRMLVALQQQQQQQQQQHRQFSAAAMASRGGLPPSLQSMVAAGHDLRSTGQRFMVDDFAGAGALLSRPEQDFLLSRYNPAASAMHHHAAAAAHLGTAFTDMELAGHAGTKIADLLMANQGATLNGGGVGAASASKTPKMTRLPCQARGMKADHNSSVRHDSFLALLNVSLCVFSNYRILSHNFLCRRLCVTMTAVTMMTTYLFLLSRLPTLKYPRTLGMDSICFAHIHLAELLESNSVIVFIARNL
jgi:hypothetical protein